MRKNRIWLSTNQNKKSFFVRPIPFMNLKKGVPIDPGIEGIVITKQEKKSLSFRYKTTQEKGSIINFHKSQSA